MWKYPALLLFLAAFVFSQAQVHAQMEEPAISYDGSGIVDDSELLSDDEDYEVLSGSGETDVDEEPIVIEPKGNSSVEYEDEPEVETPKQVAPNEEEEIEEEVIDVEEKEEENAFDEEEEEEKEIEKEIETDKKIMKEDEEEFEEIEEEQREKDENSEELENAMKDISTSEKKPAREVDIIPETTTETIFTTTTTTALLPEADDKENEEIDEVDVETDLEEKDPDVDKTASTSSIFGNNQFLAAIIIGGCIGLLFAICVIFLLIYRLKKKDEGSYALDEQKKNNSTSYQYTQGQEYFA